MTFETTEHAGRAIETLNGTVVERLSGQQCLEVRWANPRKAKEAVVADLEMAHAVVAELASELEQDYNIIRYATM